jgi:hypothetical protein
MSDPSEERDIQLDIAEALREQIRLGREKNQQIKDIVDNTQLDADTKREILNLTRQANRELSRSASIASEFNGEIRESKDIEADLTKNTKLKNQFLLESNLAQKSGNASLAKSLSEQAGLIGKNIGLLKNENSTAQDIDKSMGMVGGGMKALNKLTGGQIKGLDGILKGTRSQLGAMKMNDTLAKGTKGAMQGMGVAAKGMGKSLMKGKNIYLLLLEAAIEGSNQVNKFQKEIGISYGKAVSLRNEFTIMAAKSGDLFVNSKKLQEAFFNLKDSVGFFFDTSSRASETFLNLNKLIGFSAESAGRLALITRLQGKNTEEVTSNLFKSANASAKLLGTTATAKDILVEAANASTGLQASLSKTPDALVRAAAAAKAFGTELKSLESTQNSLLQFETSIAAELEAELLTGKQINLEKARLAALNNDIAGLGEELLKQNITLTSFNDMNFVQQEAIAKSIGMQRDALGESLMKQELQSMTLDEIREKFGDQTYEQQKALSAQDKFNALVEKLQSLFGDIGVILAPVLDLVASLLQLLSPILQILGGIIGLVGKGVGAITEGLKLDQLNTGIQSAFTIEDGVIGPDGNLISTSPEDFLIATKDPSSLVEGNQNSSGMSRENLDFLASTINNKQVVFDSFQASSPQGLTNTTRKSQSIGSFL